MPDDKAPLARVEWELAELKALSDMVVPAVRPTGYPIATRQEEEGELEPPVISRHSSSDEPQLQGRCLDEGADPTYRGRMPICATIPSTTTSTRVPARLALSDRVKEVRSRYPPEVHRAGQVVWARSGRLYQRKGALQAHERLGNFGFHVIQPGPPLRMILAFRLLPERTS